VEPVEPGFLMGSGWLPVFHAGPLGNTLSVYKSRPLDNTYRGAPAWREWDHPDQAVADLILVKMEEIIRGSR
jgi:hypothetical protein